MHHLCHRGLPPCPATAPFDAPFDYSKKGWRRERACVPLICACTCCAQNTASSRRDRIFPSFSFLNNFDSFQDFEFDSGNRLGYRTWVAENRWATLNGSSRIEVIGKLMHVRVKYVKLGRPCSNQVPRSHSMSRDVKKIEKQDYKIYHNNNR